MVFKRDITINGTQHKAGDPAPKTFTAAQKERMRGREILLPETVPDPAVKTAATAKAKPKEGGKQ